MSKLLYIKASPRTQRSHSLQVANAFVEAWKEANPDKTVEVRNLFEMSLPPFDGETIEGKYNIMHGLEFTQSQRDAWKKVEAVIADFTSADRYVFAVPMWNFNIPYPLKHYLDIISQPTYTFSAGPDGYQGLVDGKVFIAYARGGDYTPGSPAEPINFQQPYLEFQLGFLGLSDIQSIAVQPTLQGPQKTEESKKQAMEEALRIAKTF